MVYTILRNMNLSSRSLILFLVGAPMIGVCVTALYLLYKKEDDDLAETIETVKTGKYTVREIKIPKSNVGVIIGRGGSKIKEIQAETGAKINFKDDDDTDPRICVIRGTPETIHAAETMIRELIMNQPLIETYKMFVPQRACGRIIGRCGESIKTISKVSNAKININDTSNEKTKDVPVTIKGTIEQISTAKTMILEKIREDDEMRQKMELSQSNRSPRSIANSSSMTESCLKNKSIAFNSGILEPMLATGNDGCLDVFISAVASPSNFWMQVCSPHSAELDHLVEEMAAYYLQEENRQIHQIKKLNIGQIVASQLDADDKWYRAEVKHIKLNDYDSNENEIELYYVDYGDTEIKKQNKLCQLRTDFLSLRFQGIECNLASVKPSGNKEDWSEAGIECFEELCHVAQWKPLRARIVTFNQKQQEHREGSPIPSVDLFDTFGNVDINIAEELVKQGHASYIKENEDKEKYLNGNGNLSKNHKSNIMKMDESDSENSDFEFEF
uniref:Tudor domain-containing protein n=2 Tax=Clastoptera arizonana TaxID=38151 RepID=A0A1B6D308_9HEMI